MTNSTLAISANYKSFTLTNSVNIYFKSLLTSSRFWNSTFCLMKRKISTFTNTISILNEQLKNIVFPYCDVRLKKDYKSFSPVAQLLLRPDVHNPLQKHFPFPALPYITASSSLVKSPHTHTENANAFFTVWARGHLSNFSSFSANGKRDHIKKRTKCKIKMQQKSKKV